MNYFLDTNICIYFLKGRYLSIVKKLQSYTPSQIKISTIVQAELFYGVEKSQQKKKNLDALHSFLAPFEIIPFDTQAAKVYGEIRSLQEVKGKAIGPNDLLIASSVLAHSGVLVTNNIKELSMIPQLKLENWVFEAS